MNPKRVERLWRQEGLRVPRKAPRRRRRWATDGSCTRRRAERPNPVGSDDFVPERTQDGRARRRRTIGDAFTRECRSSDVTRRRRAADVLARLPALCVQRGPPASLRSDNGPACTARAVRSWLRRRGGTTRFIAPGSPWENGSVEFFNGTLRDEGLNPEIFTPLGRGPDPHRALAPRGQPGPAPQRPRLPPARPRIAGDPTSPPRPLGRPEGRSTHLSTGTTIGGRSLCGRFSRFSLATMDPRAAHRSRRSKSPARNLRRSPRDGE